MLRIFIIGTTGVGKTKLSIQLAKHLKGQIISSDSKQLYKHASIMTAKVTEQQAEGVPHHMVDVLELHENAYNRNRFFGEAFGCMQRIEEKGKVAITVGGTNYYTETLLYDLQTLNSSSNEGQSDEQGEKEKSLTPEQSAKLQQLKSLTKQERYELLKSYDSLIAQKVHRNNQQKINLFLQRMIISKRKISQHYQTLTPKLRQQRTIVFWLRNSNKEELLGMITKRIHKMLDKAGITEIFAIYHYLHLHREETEGEVDYEQYSGAASSIGIKEFLSLYKQVRGKLLELIPKGSEVPSYQQIHLTISHHFQQLEYSKQTLQKCTEQLILDTKHYCKRQITWIKNRMFLNTEQTRQHFFVLDLQQNPEEQPMQILQRFQRQIRQKAIDIIENIREHGFGHVLEEEGHFAQNKAVALEDWKKYFCDACNLQVNGEFDWTNHLNSKRHVKQVKYLEKKEERQQYIIEQKKQAEQRRKLKLEKKKEKKEGQQNIQKVEEK